MSIGILPNVNFLKLNRDAKQVTRGRLHTGKLKVNGWVASERGVSTHANNKKFLCVRLRKGTCFGRRVLLSSFFLLSSSFFFSHPESWEKCLFPHYKVEEQPSKKLKKEFSKRKKRRQGCFSCCENCTSIGLYLARLRVIRTSEKDEVSEKPEAESLGINSTGTIHTVYASSCEYPRKSRTNRLEKYKSKFLIGDVPTL